MKTPPNDHPAYPTEVRPTPPIIAFLRSQGYVEYPLRQDIQPWWRRGLEHPLTWDTVPSAVAARLELERDTCRAELDRLKSATPRSGFLTSEFFLAAGGMVATAVVAAQGQLMDLAAELGPVGGKVVNVILALATAGAAGRYAFKRSEVKAIAASSAKPENQ
jgi:hypothetical protein